jgi:hydroxymethylbilane synthase
VLAALGGGCQLPVGVYARTGTELMHATAVVAAPDGSRCLRESSEQRNAIALAHELAQRLLARGALDLLACAAAAEGQ